MWVYLLHLDQPLSHAQHYVGFTTNLRARLMSHRLGRSGARYMEVVKERGIGFRLVRTWSGDRNFERRIKRLKNAPRYCPICNPSPCRVCGRPLRSLESLIRGAGPTCARKERA